MIYAVFSLATATTMPAASHGFMPFQDFDLLWNVIGFSGVGIFGSRFVVQWLYSERHKESRIPTIFWWQSLVGTLLCLAYFLRQQDLVGISGYLFNIIPYVRNLMLVYRKKRADALVQAQGNG
jgi:lipid-A-disaccharide synthase-like uncharacterized protein